MQYEDLTLLVENWTDCKASNLLSIDHVPYKVELEVSEGANRTLLHRISMRSNNGLDNLVLLSVYCLRHLSCFKTLMFFYFVLQEFTEEL